LSKKLEFRSVRSKKKTLKEVTETGHNGDYAYYSIVSNFELFLKFYVDRIKQNKHINNLECIANLSAKS